MIYKFKSKATGDVIMLGPNGDQLLRLIGHEVAPKGIVEVVAMPAAIAALVAAVAADESSPTDGDAHDSTDTARQGISVRQRVWPMIEMLKSAHAAGQVVVWGV